MSYTLRIFFLDDDDTVYRVALAKYERMNSSPEQNYMSQFSGRRVRTIEALIELNNRLPVRVVRLVFEVIQFDSSGKLDVNAIHRQNVALIEQVVGDAEPRNSEVVDASNRFIVRGSRWQPSRQLEQRIRKVLLGQVASARL